MTPVAQKIAIVGMGPTGLYVLAALYKSGIQLDVTIFERGSVPAVGYPYSREHNSVHMLSNIASIEIPPLCETFYAWLVKQPGYMLASWLIDPARVTETDYYPRLALGAFFRSQFNTLVRKLRSSGHRVSIRLEIEVIDIRPQARGADIVLGSGEGEYGLEYFPNVVISTGHQFEGGDRTIVQGMIGGQKILQHLPLEAARSIGILGSSLSAIDAAVAIAQSCGRFEGGLLDHSYKPCSGSRIAITMMSRKGLLPEADFFYPLPMEPNVHMTVEAVRTEVNKGADGLLDRVFALMLSEIADADESYLSSISKASLTADTFSEAHLKARHETEPFTWAQSNLLEAHQNHEARHVVAWRYAVLRCHEVIAEAIPYFNDHDTRRFNKSLRNVFIDNYASVPLLSVARLLALHRAGVLNVVSVGHAYKVEEFSKSSFLVKAEQFEGTFDTLIDARGQNTLPLQCLPFPSLRKILQADLERRGHDDEEGADKSQVLLGPDEELLCGSGELKGIYFWALPFLLDRRPFIQGLTASNEAGINIAQAICKNSDA